MFENLKKKLGVDIAVWEGSTENKIENTTNLKLFKICHCYASGDILYFVSSDTSEELREKCAWIEFKAEELIDEGICLFSDQIFTILKEMADVLRVQINGDFDKRQLERKIDKFDMYFVRESFCGPKSHPDLMNKYSHPVEKHMDVFKKEFGITKK